jgi:hypothetical protein
VSGVTSSTEPSLAGATNTTLNSTYGTFWQSEYSRYASGQLLTAGHYAGTVMVNDPAIANATSVDDTDIRSALYGAALQGWIPFPNSNTIFVPIFHGGQTVTIKMSGINSQTGFCAYHSWFNAPVNNQNADINYAVMPDESTNIGCAYAGPYASAFDDMTTVLSHELVETVTDPQGPNPAWGSSTGFELGDICAYSSSANAAVTSLTGYTYQLQYIYSLDANACLATKTASWLSATTSSGVLDVNLQDVNGPIPSATVYVDTSTGSLTTMTTDQNGQATFPLPGATDPSTLTIAFAGSSVDNGAFAIPGTPPSMPSNLSLSPNGYHVTATYSASPSATSYLTVLTPGSLTCQSSTLSGTFNNLTTNTTYQAVTYAQNSAGSSSASPTATVTLGTPPTWPTNVVATPGASQLIVSWTASTSPGVLSYVATASPGGQSCTYVVSSPETDTCTITGLTNGTTYQVSVVAQNASGSSAPYGASGTPGSLPSSPTNVAATATADQ